MNKDKVAVGHGLPKLRVIYSTPSGKMLYIWVAHIYIQEGLT